MKEEKTPRVKPWTPGLTQNHDGHWSLAGRDLNRYLTHARGERPFYLLSLDVVLSRARAYEQMLKSHLNLPLHFHFAMKSNHHPRLLSALAGAGYGVDVVSGGEMLAALREGFAADKVVFSGVAKSASEIRTALEQGAGQLNVESEPELRRITQIARDLGRPARVALRVNPSVRAETHPSIATGFRENKFGIDPAELPAIADWISRHGDILQFQGLSVHIGSQLLDFAALEEALEKTRQMEDDLARRGLVAQSLDVGGGVGISYRGSEDDDFKTLEKYATALQKSLKGYTKPLRFEPGRFWVARAGVLCTKVEYVKRTPHKNFLILNAGMNALMRPMLYEAYHRTELIPSRLGEPELFDVVGPVCESTDVLGTERKFVDPREGDWILIGETGAYGSVLGSDYNLLGEVPEHIWEDQT